MIDFFNSIYQFLEGLAFADWILLLIWFELISLNVRSKRKTELLEKQNQLLNTVTKNQNTAAKNIVTSITNLNSSIKRSGK